MNEPSKDALEFARKTLGEASRHWLTVNYGRMYLDEVVALALDTFAQQAGNQALEEAAKIADSFALRSAESAQIILENGAKNAREAQPGSVRIIRDEVRDKQNYLHGKRHCAVEIAVALRALKSPAKETSGE